MGFLEQERRIVRRAPAVSQRELAFQGLMLEHLRMPIEQVELSTGPSPTPQ
jgi:hypothetical protein